MYTYALSLLNLPPTSFRTVQFSLVQSHSHVQHLETSWTAARQASLSITKSWSLLKLMSIKLVMPSNHLILCRPFLLLPSIFPSIRIFSIESVLHIWWPKNLRFSFRTGSFYTALWWVCSESYCHHKIWPLKRLLEFSGEIVARVTSIT